MGAEIANFRQHTQVSGLFGNFDCHEVLQASEKLDTGNLRR